MGEGFTEGKHSKELGEHLTGLAFLPTSALTTNGFRTGRLDDRLSNTLCPSTEE